MRWRRLFLTIAALAISGLVTWGVTTAMSQEQDPPEREPPGAAEGDAQPDLPDGMTFTDGILQDADGRLIVWVFPYRPGGPDVCLYDADVEFHDGKVGVVKRVGDFAKDHIRPGDPIADLPPELETGRTIPIPVHLGEDGKIRPGYASCEDAPI